MCLSLACCSYLTHNALCRQQLFGVWELWLELAQKMVLEALGLERMLRDNSRALDVCLDARSWGWKSLGYSRLIIPPSSPRKRGWNDFLQVVWSYLWAKYKGAKEHGVSLVLGLYVFWNSCATLLLFKLSGDSTLIGQIMPICWDTWHQRVCIIDQIIPYRLDSKVTWWRMLLFCVDLILWDSTGLSFICHALIFLKTFGTDHT